MPCPGGLNIRGYRGSSVHILLCYCLLFSVLSNLLIYFFFPLLENEVNLFYWLKDGLGFLLGFPPPPPPRKLSFYSY